MSDVRNSNVWPISLRGYIWGGVVLWTVVVAASLTWNIVQERQGSRKSALVEARVVFEKDVVYRRWNAGHGGVYVPITEETPPNPYLSHIPARDITTLSGRRLTLMNPAYMTRQVHELAAKQYGIRGHITSLRPIRPENAPDPWETEALHTFEDGETELYSVEEIEGEAYLRMMRPFVTEESCLKCHAVQGYKVGDIRGGISVSVPMAPLLAIAREHIITLALGHGMLWVMGLVGIAVGSQRLRQRVYERVQVKEALRKSEERYRSVVEDQTEMICRFNPDGTYVFVNDIYCRFFGKTTEELVGNRWLPDAHPEDLERIQASLAAMPPTNPVVSIENRVYSGKGDLHWYQFANRGFYDPNGNLLEIQSVGRDITERTQAEEEIEKFKSISDNANYGMAIANMDGSISYVNEYFATTHGYIQNEMIGKPFSICHNEEQLEHAMKANKELMETGTFSLKEIWHQRKDGSVFPTLMSGIIIKDVEGKPAYMAATAIDITERKKAEEQIKASLAEKIVLLKEIHHRVKNNLQVISSLLDMQSESIEDPQALQMFQVSQDRVKSMALIHERLYQSETLASIDAADYIQSLSDSLMMTYGEGAQAVVLDVQVDEFSLDLDSAIPCGLILNELISNALKYAFPRGEEGTPITEEQTGEIRVELHLEGDQCILEVRDNGVGLPPDLDFQETSSLGLQLVNLLTRQLKGTIELDRKDGTAFRITFAHQEVSKEEG